MAGHVEGFKPLPALCLSVTTQGSLLLPLSLPRLPVSREKGIGYLKHFVQPFPVMLPLNLIEELVRPLSLSLRLYGNIFGEEMVVAVLLSPGSLFRPDSMRLLGLLFGFIRAIVFTTLTAIIFLKQQLMLTKSLDGDAEQVGAEWRKTKMTSAIIAMAVALVMGIATI